MGGLFRSRLLEVGTRTAYARKVDIDRFRAKARRREIPENAIVPLAVVFAACRKAQIEAGPGYYPLDAILDALPPTYVENWLKKRRNN